jgi:hypothetical protein
LQPFSVGPRNCIGQGLAMGEMRAILARVVWHFDFELCKGSENWDQQKVFSLWEKGDCGLGYPREVSEIPIGFMVSGSVTRNTINLDWLLQASKL